MTLAHWDDVPFSRNALGSMDAEWQRLGDASGGFGVGVNRVRVAPGMQPTPAHSHNVSEEIFFVLSGGGLFWYDGATCEVRAGDVVRCEANSFEHTFRAGDDGLEYLVFGTRHPVEYGWLPQAGAVRSGYVWWEGRSDNPWEREPPTEFAPPGERPEHVRNLDDYEPDEDGDRLLAPGLRRAGLNWFNRTAGLRGAVPHCHSAEHEAFVVLGGTGRLELWDRHAEIVETHDLRPGHVVSRPAGSRVSHSIVAGEDGIQYLAYGTREPNDICFYPRSRKLFFRGVGVITRVELLDYWDGESVTD